MLYHPLFAFEHKELKTAKGKAVVKVPKQPKDYDQQKGKYKLIKEDLEKEYGKSFPKEFWTMIQIPCGQCIGCKMETAQDWAVRCLLETKLWDENYFVTLTYDEEHVPLHPVPVCINKETGEAGFQKTLHKPDFTKFMKDLRRHHEYHFNHQGIRFYMCGEYGSQTHRPHYHRLLFNMPLNDLKPYFINKNHQQVYTSEYLQKIWGKGIVSVGEITYESRAYTARYILKKQHINDLKPGQMQEFTNMSRMPGIGQGYYDKFKDEIYKNDELTIKKALGMAINTKPPKYFDELYDLENNEKMTEIKLQRRKMAQENRERKNQNITLLPSEQLKVAERNYASRVATLKRGLKEDDF